MSSGILEAEVARAIVLVREKLISDVLAKVVGEKLKPESFAGRLTSTRFQDGVEILALDGNAILELHPVQFETRMTTDGNKEPVVKATQRYVVLYKEDVWGYSMKVYRHKNGCGAHAFLYSGTLTHGERIRARDAFHMNGEPFHECDELRCDNCGAQIGTPIIGFFEEWRGDVER